MSAMGAALERLRSAGVDERLDRLCARHGVALLAAFGSVTRDSGAEPNDLDLAVAWRPGSGLRYSELWDDLAELAGTGRLDLMDLSHASVVGRAEALGRGLPLYEAERGAFANAQIAAILERWDTAWLRQMDLERLAS